MSRPYCGSIQPQKISDRYDSPNPFKNLVTERASRRASQIQFYYLDFFLICRIEVKKQLVILFLPISFFSDILFFSNNKLRHGTAKKKNMNIED
jgi:hypothetical protein